MCSAAATLAFTTSTFAMTSVFGTLPSVYMRKEAGEREREREREKKEQIRDNQDLKIDGKHDPMQVYVGILLCTTKIQT